MKRTTKRKHSQAAEFFNMKRNQRHDRAVRQEKQRDREWRKEELMS